MDPHETKGKGQWVAHEQDRTTAHDNTGLCLFVGGAGGPLETFVPCTTAATGVSFTVDSFLKAGERTWNLERIWNTKAGLTKADDSLPKRLLKEAHKTGPSAGVTVDLESMLTDYYQERGWDKEGIPSQEKLIELGSGISVSIVKTRRTSNQHTRPNGSHTGRNHGPNNLSLSEVVPPPPTRSKRFVSTTQTIKSP